MQSCQRAYGGDERLSASGRSRSAIIATNGSMSPPSLLRRAARPSGSCRTASTNPSSPSCSKPSHATPAPDATASSFFNSTRPAGTRRKTCPSRTASGSSTRQPSPPNSSGPNISGRSSTSRSPTSTSKPSTILDAVVALRCRNLNIDRSLIAQHTGFHWWPKSATPN